MGFWNYQTAQLLIIFAKNIYGIYTKIALTLIALCFRTCDFTKILDSAKSIYKLKSFKLKGKKWFSGAIGVTTSNGFLVAGLVKEKDIFISAF